MLIPYLGRQSLACASCYVRKSLACAAYFGCVSMLISAQGCQFAPRPSTASWPWQKDVAKAIPERIVPVWTDSVLHQPSQPGVRGFGGRVYFYGKENTAPVEVDGNFAVYVFDADDNAPTDQKPLRKYVFTADQFKTHMSKTSIGPSYSVWIPWGEVGEPARRLSLISRFEGREGGTTISEPTIKMLPGVPVNKEIAKDKSETTKVASSPVSHAAYADKVMGTPKEIKSLSESKIESIDLPPAFQRHLRVPASAGESFRASENAAPTKQSASDPSASNKSLQNGNKAIDSTEAGEDLDAWTTTKIYDYRTRGSQRTPYSLPSRPTKTDIREGRWIQSVSRATTQ